MKYLFSKDNFMKIFYQENKKGRPLEQRLERLNKIKHINEIIKSKEKGSDKHKQALRIRRKLLERALPEIEKNIAETKIQIGIATQFIKNKQVYQYKSEPATSLLIDKQIQENLKNSFGIRMPNHKEIIAQVKSLFNDNVEKYICRLDIKSFFESIPHAELKVKISKNQKFDAFSKNTIFQILDQYATITSSPKGIPRGIGLSSCLAEVYMQDFDRKIRSWDSVFFYARFVDDIVIFTTSDIGKELGEKIKELGLKINPQKNKLLFYNGGQKSFEFLGYSFQKSKANNIEITLSSKKMQKIRNKIQKSIDVYNQIAQQGSAKKETFAWQLLNQRLRFLTGNTRLFNTKSNVFVGIYHSNSFITNESCLDGLDKFFQNTIEKKLLSNEKSKQKLKERFSFSNGFSCQKFHPFTHEQIKEITKIWKNL